MTTTLTDFASDRELFRSSLSLILRNFLTCLEFLDLKVKLPDGEFTDKVLPTPTLPLQLNEVFTPDYFVALHNITAAAYSW